jgi:hypothetical protein
MPEYEPQRITKGWQLEDGDLIWRVESPHLDRGVIRGAVSVHVHDDEGDALLFCDRVSLTSAQARRRVVKALVDKGRAVDERPCWRCTRLATANRHAPKTVRVTGVPRFRKHPLPEASGSSFRSSIVGC